MTAKEYLSQAYRLDQRINSKLEQIRTLNELATKTTSTISDMPKSPSPSQSKMADAVAKIADLKNQIAEDTDRLVDIKVRIAHAIKAVDNVDLQLLLELRYLCYHTWEQIAVELEYCIDNVYKLHRRALRLIKVPEKIQ